MPVNGGIPPSLVKRLVEKALQELHVVISNPPSGEEKQVDNLYIVQVEDNPRLEVEYEE